MIYQGFNTSKRWVFAAGFQKTINRSESQRIAAKDPGKQRMVNL